MSHDLQLVYERHLETFYSPTQKRDREGQWTTGGSSTPDTTPRRRERTEEWSEWSSFRASSEGLVSLGAYWKQAKDEGRMTVRIRIPASVIGQVIQDGAIKNQYETGQSGGMLDPQTRQAHEKEMFGPKSSTDPVYGYIHIQDDKSDYSGVGMYGELGVVLKNDVLERSYLTVGDSLNIQNPPAPLAVKELDTLKGTELGEAIFTASSDVSTARQVSELERRRSNGEIPYNRIVSQANYIEAQIPGGRISLSDIDHIVIPSVDRFRHLPLYRLQVEQVDAAEMVLKAAGIRVVKIEEDSTSDFSAIAAAARRQAARTWLGGTVEGLTALQVDEVLELACHDASCRPPTSGGTGGSLKTQAGYRGIHVYFTTSDVTEAIRVYSGNATVADMDKILSNEDVGANWWTSSEGGSLDDAKEWASGIDDDPIDVADDIRDYDEAMIGMQLAITARLPAGFRHETSGYDWDHSVPNTDKLVIDAIDYSVDNGNTWHTIKVNGKIVRKVTSGLVPGGRYGPNDRGVMMGSAEELACHDASCAPPPVGTGGSKSAGATGSVEYTLKRGTTAERVALAESLFNHDLPLGFTSHIESDSFEDGILANPKSKTELFVEGRIRDQDGGYVGHFERHIEMEPNGTLVAHHDTLVINSEFQGMGLAQSFTSQSIEAYQNIGVERIEVATGMSVGPFAWARQGYQFEPKHEAIRKQWIEDRLLWVKKVADEGAKDKWSQDDARQMKKAAQDLINASNRGEPVQPIHVASLGEQRFRWTETARAVGTDGRMHDQQYETWPGKEVLLNWNDSRIYGDPGWSGVKYIDQVTASALEEFYSPTQPRDKEGQWTRVAGYTPASGPKKGVKIDGLIQEIRIKGYDGEDLKSAEAYKFHGPRHVADSMDPDLRARVTANLLKREFRGGGSDLPGELEDYVRDLGFVNGGQLPIGLAMQAAHLYEALNNPEVVGWDYAKVDKIRGLIDDYDTGVMNDAAAAMKKASDEGTVPGPGFEALKAARATKLHDSIYKLTGVDATTGLIGAVNRSWQVSASDTISVAAHLTVAKTHGLDNATVALGTYMKDDRIAKAQKMLEDIGEDNMKAITDATYAVTQRELKHLFGDETLTVWRGVADNASLIMPNVVQPSPLSSWSTSSTTADEFAGNSQQGLTMRIENIPHERIYSLATITGMGSLSEQEVVLLGHDYDVDAFAADYDPAFD